ncbi:MAG: hypothetical protein OEU26_27890 [Candidatus Tectomicrobia bacterium]|nr:hypothetical protein [Candidatus Tectomicrobia bacterium]
MHPATRVELLTTDRVQQAQSETAMAVGEFEWQDAPDKHHNHRGHRHHGRHDHYDHYDHHGQHGHYGNHSLSLVAVTVHDYGAGRAIYMGFDLLAEAALAGTDSVAASLLHHNLPYL